MDFNPHTALFLVNTQCRGIRLAYEWCDGDGKNAKGEKVNTDVFKTLDQSIRVGDLVLGETHSRHNLCVYKVVEVDIEVNLEHGAYIPWVAGKVDANLRALKSSEDEMLSAIRRRDKEKQRAKLAETMMTDYGDVIKNLSITNVPAIPKAPND